MLETHEVSVEAGEQVVNVEEGFTKIPMTKVNSSLRDLDSAKLKLDE